MLGCSWISRLRAAGAFTPRLTRLLSTTRSITVQPSRVAIKQGIWTNSSCTQPTFSKVFCRQARVLSTGTPRQLDDIAFHKLANETLDELAEFFEDLGDSGLCSSDFDVALADGVLTVNVGGGHGTYVINKQSPNKQIWFSSPTSGPKRYDVVDGRWRYSHDGVALHDLLQKELSHMLGTELDFTQLRHSHIVSDEGNWEN